MSGKGSGRSRLTRQWEATPNAVTVRRAGAHSSRTIHDAMFDKTPARRDLHALKEGIRRRMRGRHARD